MNAFIKLSLATVTVGCTATSLVLNNFGSIKSVSAQSTQIPLEQSGDEITKPVAQFDRNAPVKVTLVNQTKRSMEYGLSTGETRLLAPGENATLGPLSVPISIFVYPIKAATNRYRQIAVSFDVSVTNNLVTVNIQPLKRGTEGDSVVLLRRLGTILVY